MSKLHVNQIEGYLTPKLTGVIDMADYASHTDKEQVRKAFLTRALATLAVANLAEAPLADVGLHVTDGGNDGGIDHIFFDAKESTLYLTQTKWHEDGHGSIALGDALKFIEGVKKVLDNDLNQLNAKVQSKKTDIERALFNANSKFILVVAHTGQESLGKEVEAALTDYVDSQNDTSELMHLRVLSQSDLHRAVSAGVSGAPISVDVQLTSWGQIREPHFAIYGQVSATDVARWMELYGPRLFEKNLRQFLGGSTVNQDLVDTLTSRPEDFWYFNNGITAVSADVAKKPIGGNSTESGTFECQGFSIVNGAQTVGSIHAAAAQNQGAVSHAKVPIRIISSAKSGAAFGTEVTRCTNTQNAIEKRDFVALDPEQERIRQELHIDGIEYVYKAGSGIGTGAKTFDLTEATVALACSSTDVSLAVQAKREVGRLWDDIGKPPYKQLFNPGVTGPDVWEAVQALRAVDACLQGERNKYTGRDGLVCVHGNRFIHWASLRALGFNSAHTFTSVSSKVPAVVDQTVKKVVSAVKAKYGDSYPASLFKNLAKCRALADLVK